MNNLKGFLKHVQVPLHWVADQDSTHLMQEQWMLDRLVQHPEHDREPAKEQVNTTVSN